MALKKDTQEALLALKLAEVPPEWVNTLWEGDFCNEETITLPYHAVEESVLLNEENWQELVEACRKWPQASENGGFWTTLMEVGVSYKCLLSLLYCLMERTKLRVLDRICAIHASQLYLILLQLPSGVAFKLFHPMIFQKSLDVFHLFPENIRLRNPPLSGCVPKGKHGRRKRKLVEEEVEEGEDATVVEQGREGDVKMLLKQLIRELYVFLTQRSLAEFEVSRYQLVQILLHMCRMELGQTSPLVLGASPIADQRCPIGQDAPIYILAWGCLAVLCRVLHGSIENIVNEVFRQLLPSLLMLSENGDVVTTTPLPPFLTTCSKHSLTFVDHVIRSNGEQTHVPLKKLVQHVCTKIPDRAEYRNQLAMSVSRLLSLLPDEFYSEMLDWLYKFSRNTKIVFRVFALDVFNVLLLQPLAGSLTEEAHYRLTLKFPIRIILSRCSDKAPSVRGRALTCLASAAANESSSELTAAIYNSVFSQLLPNQENLVVEMIHRRTLDEKVGVRRAGLQALEAVVRLDKTATRLKDIAVIHERCLDPALSVRKQAITSLTTILLERKDNTKLQCYWLDGVLPMVMDKEVGGEDKCFQVIQDVLLNNLTSLDRSTGGEHHLAWQLLLLMAEDDRVDLHRYLHRVIERWHRAGRLTQSLVKAICSHTESTDHLKASWMLLAEMSQFSKFIETKFLFTNWNKYSSSVSRETCSPLVQILVVIGNLATTMSKTVVQNIKADIIQLLKDFKLNLDVIQTAVNTLCFVCSALTTQRDYQSSLNEWCQPLLEICEDYLSALIKKEGKSKSLDPEDCQKDLVTCLFTLGEVAQLCPSHTSHHLCRMVQSILLASSDVSTPISASRATSAFLPSSQSSQGPVQLSQMSKSGISGLSGLVLPTIIRAHAYITLGKLCLQNEDLAKKSVVQMAQELLTSKHPIVRNNIIINLCDLVVRYSTRVDPYIHVISSCLKDESLLVRKQTLILLSRLLQEDYIKWKGSLFFHFVSCLVDEGLSRFAEFCLVHLLQVRYPAMFYQHFVESIFFFNSYEKHKVYNHFKQTDQEKKLFSLKGKKNNKKRMTIYTFLLSHMSDQHRFQLTAKLCQEVIGGLVDGVIPLDDESVGVVRDTLEILASKEIKLTTLRRNMEEDLLDEGDHVRAAVAKVQTKVISQLVKKNVIENVVPIIIAAKHLFEKEHDPLLRELLLYLKELMQDYRSEVGEILAGDPQLVQEIQFDLKRFDEEQKRAVQSPAVTSPHGMMTSRLLSPGVVGTVATATLMATPPKLRTPTGTQKRTTPTPVVKSSYAPFRLALGVSPLVVVQRLPVNHTPLSNHDQANIPMKLPVRMPVGTSHPTPRKNREEKIDEDVSSPEAARARTSAINQDYMGIKTPANLGLGKRQLSIPLHRAILLSTAHKAGAQRTWLTTPSDETVINGRLASTPEGFAESLSFNISSVLPPSPIPPNSTLHRSPRQEGRKKQPVPEIPIDKSRGDADEGRRRSKRVRLMTSYDKNQGVGADIIMPSPEAKSKPLSRWKVQLK